jgi:O-methyltransferase
VTNSIGLSKELVEYINSHNPPEHPVMKKCRLETAERYPSDEWFQISQEQAAFMGMLIRMTGARRILEVGTFNGYSAMAFAIAANENCNGNSEITTLERHFEWSENARSYFREAKLDGNITLVEGDATESLSKLVQLHENHFDFCFIDADKANTLNYVDLCLRSTRPGGIVLIDNILWDGKVLDPNALDTDTVALKECADLFSDKFGYKTMICSVGDGILFIVKALD